MSDPEQEPAAAFSGTVRRVSWGLADQATSSATNFVLGLLVARSVDVADVGIFFLAFNAYALALSLSRAFSTDALVIRYSTGSPREWQQASRSATGTAAVTGAICGVASMGAGWVIGGHAGATFVALGIALPGLLIQDAWRFAFFAKAKGSQAFLNDLIWGIALVVTLALAFTTGRDSVGWLTAAWGMAANIAALAGVIQAKLVPAPGLAGRWFRANRDLSIPFLGEAIVTHGALNLTDFLIAGIAGVATLGALRAALILLGPTNVILLGLNLVAVPEGARSLAQSANKLRWTAIKLSLAGAGGVLVWGLLLESLPESIGAEVLGANWGKARVLLIPLTLTTAALAAAIGATSGVKALQASRLFLRTRTVQAAVYVIAAVIGAALGGAFEIAWAAAVGATLTTTIWWYQFSKTLRQVPEPNTPTD
jgi:O-antigen/teichoic acid export membrane protein